MATHKTSKEPLTIREKIAIQFILVVIQVLSPWEYSHQFSEFWEEIKKQLKEQ